MDKKILELHKNQSMREFQCNQALKLSDDIYLGVIAISRKAGEIAFESESHVIAYAIKMRRLNESYLLYQLIKRRQLTDLDIWRLAKKLTCYYQRAKKADAQIKFWYYSHLIRGSWVVFKLILSDYLPGEWSANQLTGFVSLCHRLTLFLTKNKSAFLKRKEKKKFANVTEIFTAKIWL